MSYFEFDKATTKLIDKLKKSSHSSSRTEVLRKALYLLNLAIKTQEDNKRLVIINSENEEKEIIIYETH